MVRDLPPQYGGKVPALAVSALTRAVDRERSIEAGYQMYLPKPVDPKALVAAVFDLYQSYGALSH
jgi:DNA-binding response OmpR family regulator